MYFWKCWRDNRTRFIFFLIVLLCCVPFTIIIGKRVGFPPMLPGWPRSSAGWQWYGMAHVVLGEFVSLMALFAALVLGSSSIGGEFREPTLGFLLTRPRPRRYWVWTCWSVGAGELLGVVFLAVVGTFGALTYLSGHVYSWRLLAATVPLFVGAVAVYSMTYFLTVLARSGEQGISYGMGILLIDLFLPMAAAYWHVHLSSVMSFVMAGCLWATIAEKALPMGQLFLYATLALVFPLAGQMVLERRDV